MADTRIAGVPLTPEELYGDQIAAPPPAPEAPPTVLGELWGGAQAGAKQTYALATEGLPALYHGVTGNTPEAQLRLEAMGKRFEEIGAQHPAAVPSYEDIRSPRDIALYLSRGVGEVAPSMIPGLGAGAAGASAARAAVARGLINAAPRTAIKAGAMTGAAGGSLALNAPEAFQDIYEDTGIVAPGTALATGAGMAALDMIPEAGIVARLMGPGARAAGSRLLPHVAKATGKAALQEGTTEVAQDWLKEGVKTGLAPEYDPFTAENAKQSIDTFLKSAAGGGAIGGAVSTLDRKQKPAAGPGVQAPGAQAPDAADAEAVMRARLAADPDAAPPQPEPAQPAQPGDDAPIGKDRPTADMVRRLGRDGFTPEQIALMSFRTARAALARGDDARGEALGSDRPTNRMVVDLNRLGYTPEQIALLGRKTAMELIRSGTAAAPRRVETPEDADIAAAHADPAPTDGQKQSGNYAKGHLTFHGLPIAIENAAGSTRSGKNPSTGEEWSVQMPAHYGYVKGTKGADGDPVDVYLGRKNRSDRVYVIDQIDPEALPEQAFDEHKAILGVASEAEARDLYARGFSDGRGPERIGAITEMPMADFKAWIKSRAAKQPVAFDAEEYAAEIEAATARDEQRVRAAARRQDRVPPGSKVRIRLSDGSYLGGPDATHEITGYMTAKDPLDDRAVLRRPVHGIGAPSLAAIEIEPVAAPAAAEDSTATQRGAGKGLDSASLRRRMAAQAERFGIDIKGKKAIDVLAELVRASIVAERQKRQPAAQPQAPQADLPAITPDVKPGEQPAAAPAPEASAPRPVTPERAAAVQKWIANNKERAVSVAAVARDLGMDHDEATRVLDHLAGQRKAITKTDQGYRRIRARSFSRPETLAEFLAGNGGIRDQGGELAAMELAGAFPIVPGAGPLVRENGRTLESARELAAEAGYLGAREDDGGRISDLLNALQREVQAVAEKNWDRRVWSHFDATEVADFLDTRRAKDQETARDERRARLEAQADELGIEVQADWDDETLIFEIADRAATLDDPDALLRAAGATEAAIDEALAQDDFQFPGFDDDLKAPETGAEAGVGIPQPENVASEDDARGGDQADLEPEPAPEPDAGEAPGRDADEAAGARALQEADAGPAAIDEDAAPGRGSAAAPEPDLAPPAGSAEDIARLVAGFVSNDFSFTTRRAGSDTIILHNGAELMRVPGKPSQDDVLRRLMGQLRQAYDAEGRKFPTDPEDMTFDEFRIAYHGSKIPEFEFDGTEFDSLIDTDAQGLFKVNLRGMYDKVQRQKASRRAEKPAAKAERAIEPPKAAKPKAPKGYGDTNKLFTADAAAAARALLKKKLGGSQLNAGLDPEIVQAGITLAGYHIEAGARKFAAFTKAMVDDLGEAVRPYLRSWYEGVRYFPGFDAEGMSTAAEIDAAPAESTETSQPKPELANSDQSGDATDMVEAAEGATKPSASGTIAAPATPAAAKEARDEQDLPNDLFARDAGPGAANAARPAKGRDAAGARPAKGDRGEPASRRDRGADGEGGGRQQPGSARPRARDGAGDAAGLPEGRQASGDQPQGADPTPEAERADRDVRGLNYAIAPGALDEARGPKAKARDNLEAIRLVKAIDAEGRPATREEQEKLARYVGWGGLAQAFPDSSGTIRPEWKEIGDQLAELLTPTEYQTASRSTQYAHYTSETVVRAMYDAVARLGFKGGQVFEPGMGIGNFAGMMPADMAAASQYAGVEMDHVTARIAAQLYPQWGVRRGDFTRIPLPPDTFDMAIGNPPFADVVIRADPKYAKHGFYLHDYFFAKTLDGLRPGGILAFVTSAGTMNKLDTAPREYMADRADLLGAIRLPDMAFKRNAGTQVTTDIIFLRKRLPGETPGDRTWTETTQVTLPGPDGKPRAGNVNRYFAEHPEMVLGEGNFADKLYEGRYAVTAPADYDLAGKLAEAIATLPSAVYEPASTKAPSAGEIDVATDEKKEGSYYIGKDDKLMQYRDGVGRPVAMRGQEGGRLTKADAQKIRDMIPVRDALRAVFAAQLNEAAGNLDGARKRLHKAYDAFVAKHGPINKVEYTERRPSPAALEEARAEARNAARMNGEEFNEGTADLTDLLTAKKPDGGRYTNSDIAALRQAEREKVEAAGGTFDEGDFNPEEVPSVITAKYPNMDAFAEDPENYRVRTIEDYDDAADKARKGRIFTENTIRAETKPEIATTADALAVTLNETGRVDIDRIAEIVKQSPAQVIEDLGAAIYRVPGADETWVTADEYLSGPVRDKLKSAEAAAARDPSLARNVEALKAVQPVDHPPSQISARLGAPWVPPADVEAFTTEKLGFKSTVKYLPALAAWNVDGKEENAATTSTWGTKRRDAYELLADALNFQQPAVYDYNEDKSRTLNKTETEAAQAKLDAIREAFEDWIWKDGDRATRLARIYNDRFNNLVAREFDGSHLTTPGLAAHFSLRPHQKRVVWRIIQTGNTYMAHTVGAGKTSAMIAAGMEMKRLGLVNKPMYVVPNHMLAQFSKEFLEQYPMARVMVADEARFHTSRRKQFMADVAASDIDAVVITHASFGKIPISDAFQAQLIQKEIDLYKEVLEELDGEDRVGRKRVEKQIERMENRLVGREGVAKDQTLTFEEMGIDYLFVDEAHLFRKLDFSTKQGNIKGITSTGSKMAWDLYVKTRYLEQIRPRRNLTLASGTPITNTLAELFTVERYLAESELQKQGIAQFDNWAGVFGTTRTRLEKQPSGAYKPVTRFAKFTNLAELSAMFRDVADIVTSDDLTQYVTRPAIRGGKINLVLAKPSFAFKAYQKGLGERMKKIAERTGPPQKGDDIMLTVINDGRHSAIDMRLIDPGADNDPGSKLNLMIDRMFTIWAQTRDREYIHPVTKKSQPIKGATQIVFSDLGIKRRYAGGKVFSAYDYIKSELIRRGVPAKQIAFMRDYGDHAEKQRLFNDVNDGKVTFLIGSTGNMGTGVNAQRRVVALHNLDAPWYPADLTQRIGRAHRQGNQNDTIDVFGYATEESYDATMWDLLALKQGFIDQIMSGAVTDTEVEDVGEADQYAVAAALATGDPRVIRQAELQEVVNRLRRQQAAHQDDQVHIRREIADAKGGIEFRENRVKQIKTDLAARIETKGDAFRMTVDGKEYADRGEAGRALFEAMEDKVAAKAFGQHRLGTVGGFDLRFEVVKTDSGKPAYNAPEIVMPSGHTEYVALGEVPTARGVMQSIEGILRNLDTKEAGYREAIAGLERRIKEYESRIGIPFAKATELKKAQDELKAINDALSAEVPKVVATEGPQSPLADDGQAIMVDEDEDSDDAPASAKRTGGDRFSRKGTAATRPAPGFFSALTRGVEQTALEKANPAQWAGTIRNLTTKGVKQDEVDWSGVMDWLAQQQGAVTKAELVAFLRANEVQVREVVKDEGGSDFDVRAYHDVSLEFWNGLDPIERADLRQQMIAQEGAQATKYDEYTIPGGENYRELLLTLPEKTGGERGPKGWGDTAGGTADTKNFRSSHFDEPNVLAHIRFNERTDAEGKRVLFIEEIQSDWHQKGRRKGYGKRVAAVNAGLDAKFNAEIAEVRALFEDPKITRKKDVDALLARGDDLRDRINAAAHAAGVPENIVLRLDILNNRWSVIEVSEMGGVVEAQGDTPDKAIAAYYSVARGKMDVVPDAPFKTQWPEFAFKRALRWAAENDFDKIAWTTGEMQADRYDLSQQVDSLRYNIEAEHLSALKDGQAVINQHVSQDKLPDVVGKEIAERLLKSPRYTDKSTGRDRVYQRLDGIDLKIGQHGMAGFYDKMLPGIAGKIGKKFGAKVGRVKIPGAPVFIVRDDDGVRKTFQTLKEAEDHAEDMGGEVTWDGTFPENVHALDITPEMRAGVMAGQPLWKRGAAAEAPEGDTDIIRERRVTGQTTGVDRAYSPEFRAKLDAFRDKVFEFSRRVAPGLTVQTFDQLWADIGQGAMQAEVQGAYDLDRAQTGGGHLAAIALTSADGIGTVAHEALHYLRAAGAITDQEWAQLERRARDSGLSPAEVEKMRALQDRRGGEGEPLKRAEAAALDRLEARASWAERFRIADHYDGFGADIQVEEAIAEAFGAYINGRLQVPPGLRRVFEMVKAFLERARNWLQGEGFTRPEDIFAAADRGEIGARVAPYAFDGRRRRGGDTFARRGDAPLRDTPDGSIDRTAAGEQTVLPGAERITDRQLAERRMQGRKGTDRAQAAAGDLPLFDTGARGQGTLFSRKKGAATREATPGTPAPLEPAPEGNLPAPTRLRGTPEQEAAIAKVMAPPDRRGLVQQAKNWMAEVKAGAKDRVLQGVFDQFHALKVAEQRTFGKQLDASVSAYEAALRTRNLDSVMSVVMKHNPLRYDKAQGVFEPLAEYEDGTKTKGFVDIFEPLAQSGKLELWKGYAVARRAKRLLAEGRERILDDADIDALLTLGREHPEFDGVFQEWQRFNRAMLDMAEAADLINPEQRALWERADYIPFYRVMDDQDGVVAPGKNAGITGQRPGIKQLKGGESQLNDVVENMVMNMTKLVDASFKNVAARRMVALLDGTEALTRQAKSFEQVYGVSEADAAKALGAIGVADQDQKAAALSVYAMASPRAPDVVSVMVGGRPRYYTVNDPLLLRAVTALRPEQTNAITRIMGLAKRVLTQAVTLDPAFMIRNAVRDTLSASIQTTERGLLPGVSAVQGFTKALREDPSLVAIMAAGGGSGAGFYDTSPKAVRKELERRLGSDDRSRIVDSLVKAKDLYLRIGSASEAANRIAIYDAAIKDGATKAQAVAEAQDLLNFTMRGDFAAIRFLTEVVPFMNARLQGLYKLGRAAGHNPKAMLLRGALLTAATLALMAANWDDEEYWNLEEWDRDAYYHVKIGQAWWRIPKPFEVGAIFSTIPERLAGLKKEGRADLFGKSMASMVMDTFAMNPVPQISKPILEQYANKNTFTGRPIVSRGLENLQPGAQASPFTSETMKQLGQAMNLSPARMEHLVRGYFGALGTYALAATDVAVAAAVGAPVRPDRRPDQYTILGSFYRGDADTRRTRWDEEFYRYKEQADQAYSTIKRYREAGEDKAADAIEAENRGPLAARRQMNRIDKSLQDLRAEQRQVYNSRALTGEEKRRRLDALQADMTKRTSEIKAIRARAEAATP